MAGPGIIKRWGDEGEKEATKTVLAQKCHNDI